MPSGKLGGDTDGNTASGGNTTVVHKSGARGASESGARVRSNQPRHA